MDSNDEIKTSNDETIALKHETSHPDDLVDYDQAAILVDRHRNRIRAWVREGLLQSWPAEEGKTNAKRLVSKSELMKAVVVSGKAAHPGGPGRADPALHPNQHSSGPEQIAPVSQALALALAQLDAERAKVMGMEALLRAERQRAEALELVARAERERAEVERLRGGDWRDRATALQAEVEALRVAQGLTWWRRLIG